MMPMVIIDFVLRLVVPVVRAFANPFIKMTIQAAEMERKPKEMTGKGYNGGS